MLGRIYIVATPIGNLGDISQRALETLREADIILTEDTRKTAILLDHYKIDKPLLSYHQQSGEGRMHEILLKLVEGKALALVTDAGTPGISDPGNELIDFLLNKEPDIKVITIPGPSSLTAALSISGLNVSKFIFLGFLPKKKRNSLYDKYFTLDTPVVFFESPYRITKTIDELISKFGGQRNIFVGQELTKVHERVIRGSLEEARVVLSSEAEKMGRVKGEIVVIFSNA